MKLDKRQLASAIIALCVLILCVYLLIRNGFVIRFAISAVLSFVWACISFAAAFRGEQPNADRTKK